MCIRDSINTTEMYYKVINCEEVDELKEILNADNPLDNIILFI